MSEAEFMKAIDEDANKRVKDCWQKYLKSWLGLGPTPKKTDHVASELAIVSPLAELDGN
jgi:hypothetical protein